MDLDEKNKRLNAILGITDIPVKEAEPVLVDKIVFHENALENCNIKGLVLEKRDCFNTILGTHYSYRIDNSRGIPSKGNMRHIHIYASNKKELFAMNIDGSSHDGFHGVIIPTQVANFLRNKNFIVPDNNIIEWFNSPHNNSRQLLCD